MLTLHIFNGTLFPVYLPLLRRLHQRQLDHDDTLVAIISLVHPLATAESDT